MSKKSIFEILDQMNLDDIKNETRTVAISNSFISADKVKQGAKVAMGVDMKCLLDLMSDKVMPILLLVDKYEYKKHGGK